MGRRRNEKWAPESVEKLHESKRNNRALLKFKVRLGLAGVHSRQEYKTCKGTCADGSLCLVRLKIYDKNDYCKRHAGQAPRPIAATAPPRAPEPPAPSPAPQPAPAAPPTRPRAFRVPPSPFSKRRNG